MINAYPLNDLHEHILDSTCKCNPTVTIQHGEIIVCHNSFDGREIIEQVIHLTVNVVLDTMIITLIQTVYYALVYVSPVLMCLHVYLVNLDTICPAHLVFNVITLVVPV